MIVAQYIDDYKAIYRDLINGYLYEPNIILKTMNYQKIINSPKIISSDYLKNHIINPVMQVIANSFYQDITSQSTFVANFCLIWFILYTTLVILAYILVWRPIEINLAIDVLSFIKYLVHKNKTVDFAYSN